MEKECGAPIVFAEHELCFAPSTCVWVRHRTPHPNDAWVPAIILGLDEETDIGTAGYNTGKLTTGEHYYMVLITTEDSAGSEHKMNDTHEYGSRVCSSVPSRDLRFRSRDDHQQQIPTATAASTTDACDTRFRPA